MGGFLLPQEGLVEEVLTISEAAAYLKCHYQTVYKHKEDWGFFKMEKSAIWRVLKTELDKRKKTENNTDRLALSVDEVNLCRSTKETKSIGLVSRHRAAKELDALLALR